MFFFPHHRHEYLPLKAVNTHHILILDDDTPLIFIEMLIFHDTTFERKKLV